MHNLGKDLTILVCSCDTYDDCWTPFFTLLKRYFPTSDVKILLNTETKKFYMDGLDIQCIHSPSDRRYGYRILNALSYVKTEYVLLLLDDFFLRTPVNSEKIKKIIEWMDADKEIACFNCDNLNTYVDYEINKYPGFKRIPPANDFILNMQAGIWRTKMLASLWHPDASPWEWETIYNVLTLKNPGYKYYCAKTSADAFTNYGHSEPGDVWGVYRGHWILEDVVPLFEKENIAVDFSIREEYNKKSLSKKGPSRFSRFLKKCKNISNVVGWYKVPVYWIFEIYRMIKSPFCKGKKPPKDYYIFRIKKKERQRFLALLK